MNPIQSTTATKTAALLLVLTLAGCGTFPAWLPSTGPSLEKITTQTETNTSVVVLDVTDSVARRLLDANRKTFFSEALPVSTARSDALGQGDAIAISIWEAPPAALFASPVVEGRSGTGASSVTALPDQVINGEGMINVPFAGSIRAAGRSPQQVEVEIAQRLKGKANQPQVMVRVARNASSNVTIVGEVNVSTRMPLTAQGERLLDALAAAGGVRQPTSKMTLQITRGAVVRSLPLDTIIQDPRQNVVLQPGDVVTAIHQPFSFTVLGATGKNEEINFEAQGISLVQALARSGGLQDTRADARGVFLFRLEEAEAVTPEDRQRIVPTPEGRYPVVYRVDLKEPATFFVAQSFPVRNKDVLYVTNAPAAELQKFLNIVTSVVYPIVNVRDITVN